jgi:hypothetical protein
MSKKALRLCIVAFLLFGVVLAASNFSFAIGDPRDFGGTLTRLTDPPDPEDPHYLYDDYWCLGVVWNCYVIFVG